MTGYFDILWTVYRDIAYLRNKDQRDALFFLDLFLKKNLSFFHSDQVSSWSTQMHGKYYMLRIQ